MVAFRRAVKIHRRDVGRGKGRREIFQARFQRYERSLGELGQGGRVLGRLCVVGVSCGGLERGRGSQSMVRGEDVNRSGNCVPKSMSGKGA